MVSESVVLLPERGEVGRGGQGGEFPKSPPAGLSLLFEQNFFLCENKGAVFDQVDHGAARFFARQRFGFGRGAGFCDRAKMALRTARSAKKCAEFHQRIIKETGTKARLQVRGGLPEDFLAGAGVDRDWQIKHARQHAGDVGLDDRRSLIERKSRDRAGRVAAHAGQAADDLERLRKLRAVFAHEGLRGAVKIPCA